MPTLPPHPDLAQLRRQAKELLRAAAAGDRPASERIHAVSEQVTLTGAQLAVAREHGFESWPAIKREVDARTRSLTDTIDAFLAASVGYRVGRASRMLAQAPEIADHSLATALVLGDERRVREEIERDPGLVTRHDPRSGWAPLHVVCASRWHLDPARAPGLLATARLLLERGADPDERTDGPRSQRPLRCAVISAASSMNNEPIIRLLLERGATPDDDVLYNAGWAADPARCLRLLIDYGADVAELAEQALAAPISTNDLQAVRVLLEAGADPARYRNDDGQPAPVVSAALAAGCELELIELLLGHGADPDAPGLDGRSPYRAATAQGRPELVELLGRHGAHDDASDIDRLLYACRRGDRESAERLLAEHPALLAELSDVDAAAIVAAAEAGDARAVRLMLDVGFPVNARGGDRGETALHTAAYAGSAETVRVLLEDGADLEARDTTWNGPPLDWALVGSGETPATAPAPDWLQTVALLLDAGASTAEITLSPEDPKPPSAEVAQLLRDRGIGNGAGQTRLEN
jgi:ankyrin repeat protein